MSINNINPKIFNKNSNYKKVRLLAGVISPIVIFGTTIDGFKKSETQYKNSVTNNNLKTSVSSETSEDNIDNKYNLKNIIEKLANKNNENSEDLTNKKNENEENLTSQEDIYNSYNYKLYNNTTKKLFSNNKVTEKKLYSIIKSNNNKANFKNKNKISDDVLKRICKTLANKINSYTLNNKIDLNSLSEKIINLKIINSSFKTNYKSNYYTISFDIEKLSKNDKIFDMTIEYEFLRLVQIVDRQSKFQSTLNNSPLYNLKSLNKTVSYMENLFNYDDFLNCLVKNKFVTKNFVNDRYVYQGCCDINGLCVSSAYDSGYKYKQKDGTFISNSKTKNSILEVSDLNGNNKILNLDCNAHVGGVAYNKNAKKVLVSGNNSVNIYDVNYILNLSNSSQLNKYKTYKFDRNVDGVDRASYLASHGNHVFVGMFDTLNPTKLSKYTLNKKGEMTLSEQYTVPYTYVQGLCITEYNGKEYYLFSCSYGRKKDSVLVVSELKNNAFKTIKSIKMPSMMEQVSLTNDGNIMAIFESGCAKYNGADGNGESIDKVDDVCYLDVEKVISL